MTFDLQLVPSMTFKMKPNSAAYETFSSYSKILDTFYLGFQSSRMSVTSYAIFSENRRKSSILRIIRLRFLFFCTNSMFVHISLLGMSRPSLKAVKIKKINMKINCQTLY